MPNPEAEPPPGVGLPSRERAAFRPSCWSASDAGGSPRSTTPRFLDHEGAELVLIGAAEDVESELGIRLDHEDERLGTADIFRQLRIRPGELPTEPLERGELR